MMYGITLCQGTELCLPNLPLVSSIGLAAARESLLQNIGRCPFITITIPLVLGVADLGLVHGFVCRERPRLGLETFSQSFSMG